MIVIEARMRMEEAGLRAARQPGSAGWAQRYVGGVGLGTAASTHIIVISDLVRISCTYSGRTPALQGRIGDNRLARDGLRWGVDILQLILFGGWRPDVIMRRPVDRREEVKFGEMCRSAGVVRCDLGDTLR